MARLAIGSLVSAWGLVVVWTATVLAPNLTYPATSHDWAATLLLGAGLLFALIGQAISAGLFGR
jgi:hypothetical protein